MTLRELYKEHFSEGGAYRRLVWPSDVYLRVNSIPSSRNGPNWLGNTIVIPDQRYSSYEVTPAEAALTDWSWIDQQAITNLTLSQRDRATKNEDTIK